MSAAAPKDASIVERRPTEVVSGLALAAAVYGFLAEASVSNPVAAVIAVVIAFVPGAVSAAVDAFGREA